MTSYHNKMCPHTQGKNGSGSRKAMTWWSEYPTWGSHRTLNGRDDWKHLDLIQLYWQFLQGVTTVLFFHGKEVLCGTSVFFFFSFPETSEKEGPGFSRPGQPVCGRTQPLPPFLPPKGSLGDWGWRPCSRSFEKHDTLLIYSLRLRGWAALAFALRFQVNGSSFTQRSPGSCRGLLSGFLFPTSPVVVSDSATSVWLGVRTSVGLRTRRDGRGNSISAGFFLFPFLSLLDPEWPLPGSGPQPMDAAPIRVTHAGAPSAEAHCYKILEPRILLQSLCFPVIL